MVFKLRGLTMRSILMTETRILLATTDRNQGMHKATVADVKRVLSPINIS